MDALSPVLSVARAFTPKSTPTTSTGLGVGGESGNSIEKLRYQSPALRLIVIFLTVHEGKSSKVFTHPINGNL